MANSILKRDADLITAEELNARLYSVRMQREKLCTQADRYNTAAEFNKRQAKIARLTAREDALRRMLRDLRRATGESL